jgi:DnaJ homolog subfamily C member 7
VCKALGEDQTEATGGRVRAILLSNRATALCKVSCGQLHSFKLETMMSLQLASFKEAYKDINCLLSLWHSYFKALRCRGRINMQMENYDAATEDFRQALDQAGPELSEPDRRALCEELRKAEDRAKAERNKTKIITRC